MAILPPRIIAIRGLRQFRDGLRACVDQIGVFVAIKGEGPHAEHAVFRLQRHLHPFGDVVRHQRRYPDAKVHIPAILQFQCRPCSHLVTIPCHDESFLNRNNRSLFEA
jgi:hypothetical protein